MTLPRPVNRPNLGPEFAIRPARLRDLEALYRLDALCFPDGGAFSHAMFFYYLHTPAANTWIVDGPHGIDAFVIAGQVRVETLGLAPLVEGQIVTLDVHPRARRRGLGRTLMRRTEDWFGAEAIGRVTLEVNTVNAPAIALYRGLGYEIQYRIPGYYADMPGKTDAWHMAKLLNDRP